GQHKLGQASTSWVRPAQAGSGQHKLGQASAIAGARDKPGEVRARTDLLQLYRISHYNKESLF
ncbi:MAG: hypothetical protein JXN59_04885, partial [Anaerolineae bacterium]|nr:hypothetical protein [Anaerolineae bacterium]